MKNSRKRKNQKSRKSIRNFKIEKTFKKNIIRKNNIRNKKIETTLFLKNKSRSKLKMEKGGMNSGAKAVATTGLAGLAVAAGAILYFKGSDLYQYFANKEDQKIGKVTGSYETLNPYTSELFFNEFNYIGQEKYKTLQQVIDILKKRIEKQVGAALETAPESVRQEVFDNPEYLSQILLHNKGEPTLPFNRTSNKLYFPINRTSNKLYFPTFPLFSIFQLNKHSKKIDPKCLNLFFNLISNEYELSQVFKIKDHYRQNESWMIIHFIDNILNSLQRNPEEKEDEILKDIGLHQEYEFLTSIIKKYKKLPDPFSEEYVWKIFDDLEEEQDKGEQVEKHLRSIEEKFLRIMIYCNLKKKPCNELFRAKGNGINLKIEIIQLTNQPVRVGIRNQIIRKYNLDSDFYFNNKVKGILIFGDLYVDLVNSPDSPLDIFGEVDFTLLKVDNKINSGLQYCSKIYGLQGTKIIPDTFKKYHRLTSVDLTGTDISEAVGLTKIDILKDDLSSKSIGLFNNHPPYLIITGLKDLKLPPLIFSKCHIESIDLTDCDISEAQFLFFSSRIINIIGLDTTTKKKLPKYMFNHCIFENINLRLNLTDVDISEASHLFTGSNITKDMLIGLNKLGGGKKLPPYMFNWCLILDTIDLSGTDISQAEGLFYNTNIQTVTGLDNLFKTNKLPIYMFANCEHLSSINLSGLDISESSNLFTGSNITQNKLSGLEQLNGERKLPPYMFSKCLELDSFDISNFDVSNARGMFQESIISKVTGLSDKTLPRGLFDNCQKITSIDLTNANIDKAFLLFSRSTIKTVVGLSGPLPNNNGLSIFYNCQNLESVDLRNYDNLLNPRYNLKGLFKDTNVNETNINGKVITKDNKVLNTKEINLILGVE